MRTTLDISDDVLFAAKETARRQKLSVGTVISDLARRSLLQPAEPVASRGTSTRRRLARLGIQPLPQRGGIVTNEAINQLRDDSAQRHARRHGAALGVDLEPVADPRIAAP